MARLLESGGSIWVAPPNGYMMIVTRLPDTSPTKACPSSCAISEANTIAPHMAIPRQPWASPGRAALNKNPSVTWRRKRRRRSGRDDVATPAPFERSGAFATGVPCWSRRKEGRCDMRALRLSARLNAIASSRQGQPGRWPTPQREGAFRRPARRSRRSNAAPSVKKRVRLMKKQTTTPPMVVTSADLLSSERAGERAGDLRWFGRIAGRGIAKRNLSGPCHRAPCNALPSVGATGSSSSRSLSHSCRPHGGRLRRVAICNARQFPPRFDGSEVSAKTRSRQLGTGGA
jgi:hypothetical protein